VMQMQHLAQHAPPAGMILRPGLPFEGLLFGQRAVLRRSSSCRARWLFQCGSAQDAAASHVAA